MNIRQFVSHEWQSVGQIQSQIEREGIPIPEVKLLKILRNMPCVLEQEGKFRQTPFVEEDK